MRSLHLLFSQIGTGRGQAVPFDCSKTSHIKSVVEAIADKKHLILKTLPDDVLLMPAISSCCEKVICISVFCGKLISHRSSFLSAIYFE